MPEDFLVSVEEQLRRVFETGQALRQDCQLLGGRSPRVVAAVYSSGFRSRSRRHGVILPGQLAAPGGQVAGNLLHEVLVEACIGAADQARVRPASRSRL